MSRTFWIHTDAGETVARFRLVEEQQDEAVVDVLTEAQVIGSRESVEWILDRISVLWPRIKKEKV